MKMTISIDLDADAVHRDPMGTLLVLVKQVASALLASRPSAIQYGEYVARDLEGHEICRVQLS